METEFSPTSLVSLTNASTGRFLVSTKTSDYLLDMDERVATRSPGEAEEGYFCAPLRKDGEEFRLETVLVCELGKPMLIMASGIADDEHVATARQTTPVTHIESILY